jgi:hypothetical protein
VQDVVERSRQKFDMLQRYGDTVICAEVLEKELDKARKHSALYSPSWMELLPSTIIRYNK